MFIIIIIALFTSNQLKSLTNHTGRNQDDFSYGLGNASGHQLFPLLFQHLLCQHPLFQHLSYTSEAAHCPPSPEGAVTTLRDSETAHCPPSPEYQSVVHLHRIQRPPVGRCWHTLLYATAREWLVAAVDSFVVVFHLNNVELYMTVFWKNTFCSGYCDMSWCATHWADERHLRKIITYNQKPFTFVLEVISAQSVPSVWRYIQCYHRTPRLCICVLLAWIAFLNHLADFFVYSRPIHPLFCFQNTFYFSLVPFVDWLQSAFSGNSWDDNTWPAHQ